MKSEVLHVVHHKQIADVVIFPVLVNMMHQFPGPEVAAEVVFHDEAVLEHVPVRIGEYMAVGQSNYVAIRAVSAALEVVPDHLLVVILDILPWLTVEPPPAHASDVRDSCVFATPTKALPVGDPCSLFLVQAPLFVFSA